MATPYQKSPGPINDKKYGPSPLTRIDIVEQGKESKPTPPAKPTGWRPKKPTPRTVPAPGAFGSI